MMNIQEQWREVEELGGRYMVSDQGRMARIIGKPVMNRYGMVRVMLHGVWKTLRLHRIVAKMFVGDIPEGYVVHHRNQDFTDNRAENLEIMPAELHANLPHTYYQLTREDFEYIRSCRRPGKGRRKHNDPLPTLRVLSERFGIPIWALHTIQCGKVTFDDMLYLVQQST